ncbi:unnamed protein product [Rotaria sordida]|uniref:Uncharacterized protein n=1 Tax=Rotaria sordida TaxID=392033 RepID=A0A815A2H3_9BILA|nr:unnamed protein product [Rotaria sordida]CAF1330208.1 unnamed protein product [Rotaria sordida]CAF1532819.1 unnamed protein product [Rotaria sordida]CAF4106513.1 unnamed protein product [Rotaria sordida]
MKLYGILFTFILLIGLSSCRDKFLTRTSVQDYVDKFVDVVKFKHQGILSLNKTAIRQIWSFFKAKYRRFYSSTKEERARLRVFRDKLKYVLETNLRKASTYKLGLNDFSDWTPEEYQRMVHGVKVSSRFRRSLIDDELDEDSLERSLARFDQRYYYARRDENNNDTSQQPNTFDWRTKNVVSPIKHQGYCGSCYAFATVAVMESLYAIKTNSQNVTRFSEQQIVDCSSKGNSGCCGGNFEPSVKFLSEKGGKIAIEASYPYAEKLALCQKSGTNEIELGEIKYEKLARGNEKKLAEAVANYGPIFVAVDASSEDFGTYRKGVLQIDRCHKRRVTHAVVVVGYGYDEEIQKPYWIIKNSWGTGWGENGYLRLIKDAGNMCGVATQAYSAKLI